jgi:hypothetical protein
MAHKIEHKGRVLIRISMCIAICLVLLPRSSLDQARAIGLSLANTSPAAAFTQLPLFFEANQGQTDSRVQFLSRGEGLTLFLTPGQAVISLLVAPNATQPISARHSSRPDKRSTIALGIRLIGANSEAALRGQHRVRGNINYLIGGDPRSWRRGIPAYTEVEDRNVYPGIDLIYTGNRRRLEYDFAVSPGAESGRIALEFQGADKVMLDANGDLLLYVAGAIVRQPRAVAYQEIDGVRREVPADYLLRKGSQVAFQLGAYDRRRPLIIDPTVEYSTFVGSSIQGTAGWGLAVDSSGNAYVGGMTGAANFPTTFGTVQTSYAGSGDAFVSKLNLAGSDLIYSTYLGGSGNDYADAMSVDASGNAYITGQTNSTDFPVTANAFQAHLRGTVNAFVSKLNVDGSALVYSTYLGGSDWDFAAGIAVDANNNAYVTGGTRSADFPVTAGALQTTFGGGLWDVFVSKVSTDGASLIYSTYLGGNGGNQGVFGDVGWAIAVDASGNAYVTGDGTPNFPTTSGAFQTNCRSGILNAFISKINPAGSELVYSTYVGGSSWDWADAIAVDAQGNVYLGGNANSNDFPLTAGAFQKSNSGGEDGVVFKLNPTGSALQYSTYLGGVGYEVIQSIAVDNVGDAYVTGVTGSTNLPTTADALQGTQGGSFDAFITELNPQGSALVYSSYIGGSGMDWGYGIRLDPKGEVYVSGVTSSSNFPTTPGAFKSSSNGSVQTFVSKFALHPVDTTPPLITVSVSPKILWPPTGNMVPVTVSGKITDTGSGVDPSSATFAVKDEYGRVQPKGPITLTAGGAYSFIARLQASRLGSDMDGRQYRINISASDYAGNQGLKTSVITVSHDQRN